MISRLSRLLTIERVMVKYGLETLFLEDTKLDWMRHAFVLSPTRWLSDETRKLPRGERIRLALEELGPVFVKLGQMLSTRRDLLPDDIGDELALLQDQVQPFSDELAKTTIEAALGNSVESLFAEFESSPMASASVAQVHGAVLHDGSSVVVKVLRPGIERMINRDISLMYMLADMAAFTFADGKRLRPRDVVVEYDHTIHNELNLVNEASNAMVFRSNFKDSDILYIPEIYWDYTRANVLVMERISGIPIRDVDAMHAINMDMKKLAEHAVEIFYTQLFSHNYFHADMHPGNIFVSPDNPAYPKFLSVDFGIVGSLTDEDLTYLGENMLAFFRSDFRRVAQLHVDSGWVPPNTRVSEFEAAVRSVCGPIFEKPLAEISFGAVLLQLFQTARRFEMEVQPQLVLLQKTLLNIEGLGRQLYPELDLWATGKPYLEKWVMERRGPKALVNKFVEQAPMILDVMPHMPMLVHDYMKSQKEMASSSTGAYSNGVRRSSTSDSRPMRFVLAGGSLMVSASLIGGAHLVSDAGAPWWCWIVGLIGAGFLLRGIFARN